MSDSHDMKEIVKWFGVAVLAAIPIFLVLRKIAEQPESFLGDSSDIFAEELQG